MKKKIIALILTLTMFLGATACSNVSDTSTTTSTTEKSESLKEISYSLDETEKFHDISFKYDSRWTRSERSDVVFYLTSSPYIQIYVRYDDTVLNYLSEAEVISTYTDVSSNGTLDDKSKIKLTNEIEGTKIVLSKNTGAGKQYFSYVVFNYHNCLYSIELCADYAYTSVCDEISANICASLSTNDEDEVEETTVQEEETTKAVKSESAKGKEQTILDSDDIKVIYKGIENTKYGSKVKLYIENNTNSDYEFQLRNLSVNDFMCDAVMSAKISSGKKANDGFTIETDFLEENDITDINSISLSIHAINWKSYSNSFDTETVTFNP